MIDLTKLTPAPWHITGFDTIDDDGKTRCNSFVVSACDSWLLKAFDEDDLTPLEFAAIARNAFDVMIRRKWFPALIPSSQKWDVMFYVDLAEPDWGGRAISVLAWFGCRILGVPTLTRHWPDPFTALVEADEWYKKNVEK